MKVTIPCRYCSGHGSVISKALTDTIACFHRGEELTGRTVSERVGIGDSRAHQNLAKLRDMKLLDRRYDGKNLRYFLVK